METGIQTSVGCLRNDKFLKWSFSISLNLLFNWALFWYFVKRQSSPLKHKSLHSLFSHSTICWPHCVCGMRSPLAPLNPCHPTAGHLMHLSPHPAAWTPLPPLSLPYGLFYFFPFFFFSLTKLSVSCFCTLCKLSVFLLYLLGSNLSRHVQMYSVWALFTYFRSLFPFRSSDSLSPWLTGCWHSCPYEYLSFRWKKTDQDLALGEFL